LRKEEEEEQEEERRRRSGCGSFASFDRIYGFHL